MSNTELSQRIDEFLRAPNGTFLYEPCLHNGHSTLFGVKVPISADQRFSAIMSEVLYPGYSGERTDGFVYPDNDWKLELDSYVDNRTGNRLVRGYDHFEHYLGMEPDARVSDAVKDVEDIVRNRIQGMSEEDLVLAALKKGQVPDVSKSFLVLEEEKRQISKKCTRAFIEGQEQDVIPDPLSDLELDLRGSDKFAQFAIAYLSNKEALLDKTTAELTPQFAADVIHHRVVLQEVNKCLEQLESAPDPKIAKEKAIREAVQDKASVWATFANGANTLRMSIPTDMFRAGETELNTWRMTNKARDQLEAFMKKPEQAKWSVKVNIDDIVALEFKNKLIYRDDAYYDQQLTQSQQKPSLASVLQDATQRAATQQAQGRTPQHLER